MFVLNRLFGVVCCVSKVLPVDDTPCVENVLCFLHHGLERLFHLKISIFIFALSNANFMAYVCVSYGM